MRWLLLALFAAVAFAIANPLTPRASAADEVPAAPVATDQSPEPVATEPPPESTPSPPVEDPAPPPPPVEEPVPPPDAGAPPPQEPASELPASPPAATDKPASQPADGGRDRGAAAASPSVVLAPVAGAAPLQAPAAAAPVAAEPASPEALPLGFDVYDDALFAEAVGGDDTAAALGGSGAPPSIGGLVTLLPGVAAVTERQARTETDRASQAVATPAGDFRPGGSGPGQGPSASLLGGSGGSAAGIALLTLLGMIGTWLLAGPSDLRAFRISTATWRPSGYVPPIEQPG